MPFPPPPQPAPAVPSVSYAEATWAYGYVNQAGWSIPPNSIATLVTLDLAPGTWRFDGHCCALIDPKLQSVGWSGRRRCSSRTGSPTYGIRCHDGRKVT